MRQDGPSPGLPPPSSRCAGGVSAEGARSADEEILRDTLAALNLAPDVLRHWLERSRRFCERHGGEKRYAEWIALYDEAIEVLDAR